MRGSVAESDAVTPTERLLAAGRLREARTSALRALRTTGSADAHLVLGEIEEAMGSLQTAERCYRRAGSLAGHDARIRLEAEVRSANLLRIRGRYRASERRLKRCLMRAKEGADVAAIRNFLGILYKYMGRFSEAGRQYRSALRLLRGRAHPLRGSLYHNLAGLEHARGNPRRGEPYARRSVEIHLRELGPKHPVVAADLAALASLLQDQGNLDEAEPMFRRAIAFFRRTYGPIHYEVAVNLNNLAAVQAERNQIGEADRLYRRTLAIKERIFGRRHPDVAITLNNLGLLYASRGRADESREFLRRALDIFARTLGRNHPNARACLANLASIDSGRARSPNSPRSTARR